MTTILYVFGYSVGSCIHGICSTGHRIFYSDNSTCLYTHDSQGTCTCCPCCFNNYICSLVVSCGRGCYDGCVGDSTHIHPSNVSMNSPDS